MKSNIERVLPNETPGRTQQSPQHYRLTLEIALRQYQDGYITATGLVYFAIAIQRKPGWKLRLDAQIAEEQLGLKKTAFYSAISRLKADGWIEWEARAGIHAWIPVETALSQFPSAHPQPNDNSAGAESLHSQQDGFSAKAETSPQLRKSVRDRGKQSAFAETESPKPAQCMDAATPSYSLQRSINLVAAEEDAAALKKSFVQEEEEEVARAGILKSDLALEACSSNGVVSENSGAVGKEESPTTAKIGSIAAVEAPIEGIDPEAEGEGIQGLHNTESREISVALRDAGLLNPQMKALALKFTLADVQAALNLYQQRQQVKPIPNPKGWLTDCLRGKWWNEQRQSATPGAQFPPELVRWYELADKAGIIDAIELKHLPCCMGELNVRLVNRDRRRFDPPYVLTPWREAMALYPLSDAEAGCPSSSVAQTQTME